jgi:hypothetical protein
MKNGKQIIYTIAIGNGGFLEGELRQEYESALGKVSFDNIPFAIRDFLVSVGFDVLACKSTPTHHYAITKCGLCLSSNGYVHRVATQN